MRTTPSAYQHSKIYKDFKELEMAEHRSVIRFFEENEQKIKSLEFNEYFELLISYLTSLFAIGAYEKHNQFVDGAIETSILNNIKYYKERDIYQELLFNKAASFFNILEFTKAEHILKELVKLSPDNDAYINFLKRCKRKIRPSYIDTTRATSIFLFMMSAAIIAIELIVVRIFYYSYVDLVEAVRTGIFLVGIAMLLSGDLYHRWSINKKVNNFVEKIKARKKRKGTV